MVQKALHGIVGDKNISETVAVVIGKTHSQAFAVRIRYTGFGRDIGESAVAVIVIEDVCHTVVIVGMAVGAKAGFLFSTIAIALECPVHVPRNKQVELAIVVVIEKSCTCAPSSRANTSFGGDIGKGPISIVVIKGVATIAGYVNVLESVVVIVTDCNPHAVVILRHSGQAGPLGHVGEGAIRGLMK